jgi:hypothetical protein
MKTAEKKSLARLLRTTPDQVPGHFACSYPGFTNTSESVVRPDRKYLVHTILAIGDLSFDNGLPALGQSKQKFTLRSGEALHFMGDVQQIYCGVGEEALIWIHWNCPSV